MKKLIIKSSGKKGKGLFANQEFKKGEKILHVDLTGLESHTLKEWENIPGDDSHMDYVGNKKYIISHDPYSYINHSCNPNTEVKFKTIAISDIIALKDINKGEELTYDYGVTALDGFGREWKIHCKCGYNNCRKKVSIDFFKQPKFIQKRYWKNLPQSIKRKYKSKFEKLK